MVWYGLALKEINIVETPKQVANRGIEIIVSIVDGGGDDYDDLTFSAQELSSAARRHVM